MRGQNAKAHSQSEWTETYRTKARYKGLDPRLFSTLGIVEVDKDMVCDWLDRAGRHCRAVTCYLFDNLPITECQMDELWGFVRKRGAATIRYKSAIRVP